MKLRALPHLGEAWQEPLPAERFRKLKKAAEAAREAFLDEGTALAVESCDLITFPYPADYAFQGAALSPAPYIMMTNRMMVVQYEDPEGERRTLLFNPSDYERGQKAPFYATLRERYGDTLSERVLSKRHGTVEGHLARLGLSPDDVDFIAFDHLHIQDVRGWLGSYGEPSYFPRAKLLVWRSEWDGAHDPHPIQVPWYVPGGVDGVADDRVVFLDDDAWLGAGVAILRTPGHTLGNMSLAVSTDEGLFVTSENAVATECYTPSSSAIRGLSRYAKTLQQEVILNGNTRESTLDQYTSMVVEKTFAGASTKNPDWVGFFPSSELTASVLSPGLAPSFSFGALRQGAFRSGLARAG